MHSEKSPSKTECLPNGNERTSLLSMLILMQAWLSATEPELMNQTANAGCNESKKSSEE